MKFSVICPDGKDRLLSKHDTFEKAQEDAGYFNVVSECGCISWANKDAQREHGYCSCNGNHFADGNIVFVYP